jgi:CHASE3 domain sensor protein
MQESNDIKELLTAIRDAQREQLAEYKQVAERSLKLQEQAVKRQEQLGNLYRRVLVFGSLLILFIIALILYLLGKYMWR